VTLDTGLTLDLTNSGTSLFEITSPLFTAGTYDLVTGNGSVTFGGVLSLDFSGGLVTDGTDVLQLFANTGGVSGDFNSVVWSGLADGQSASFNASTGFISITAVPEPSTCVMALAGLACGGYSIWRRRKRA
jgi:hypothetical protein